MINVVIPLYNKAPHIKSTVDSVLKQTYPDFEVIVVDDGSTDGSGDIVANIKDSRLRLIRQKNFGVSAARNIGIESAQSNYIAFLDADDSWLPNHLETIEKLIRIYPGCGLYSTSYYINDKDGKLSNKLSKVSPPFDHVRLDFEGYLDFCIKYYPFWTGSICLWKPILNQIEPFNVGMVRGQDSDLWLRVAAHTCVGFINEKTAIYNTETVNRTPSRWEPGLSNNLDDQSKNLIENYALSIEEKRKLYEYFAKKRIGYGWEALMHGYVKEAKYCIKNSYRTKVFRVDFFKLLIKYLYLSVFKEIHKKILPNK